MVRFIHKEESEISVEYGNLSSAPVTSFTLKNSSAAVSGRKLYIVVAVSFGLVCILQAALNVALRLAHNSSDETMVINNNRTNLTEERDELKWKLDDFDALFQQGWVHFSYKFYYISSTKKNWNDSRADCLKRGADLVVINSNGEQKFIETFKKPLWIGLTDKETDGSWKWVDGTPLTKSYWDFSEPNNDDKGEREDCAEIRTHYKHNSWNDARCTSLKFWLCEKELS